MTGELEMNIQVVETPFSVDLLTEIVIAVLVLVVGFLLGYSFKKK